MSTASNDFEAVCIDFEAACIDFEAVCIDFEAASNDFEAVCIDFEAVCIDFEAACIDFEAACNAFEAVCIDFEAVYIDFEAVCIDFEAASNDFEAVCNAFEAACIAFEAACIAFEAVCIDFEAVCIDFEAVCIDFEAVCIDFEAVCNAFEAVCIGFDFEAAAGCGILNRMSGFVVWFTGLSGAGKSTLSALLAEELRRRGVHVEVLDGDEVRTHLSKGLGFSREDRDVNVRRIGFVARLIARAGGCAITAAISPYKAVRDEQRAETGRFVEVYCECAVPVLAARDPKGLYKKALAGEIQHFTGIDDPYEPPDAPDLVLSTGTETREESLGKILAKLEALGYVGPPPPRPASSRDAYSHVIGVDDAPFDREARGRVMVVATAFSALRLEGVLTTRVRRDGSDATGALAACISGSRYAAHTRLVLLQGIALAGFNVVDIHALSEALGMAVLVVARRRPSLRAMREALLGHVPGGARKWSLIEKAGPMEPCAGVMVQRAGISLEDAAAVVSRLAVNGAIPEPLRMAHLIAGGVTTGQSRGRT